MIIFVLYLDLYSSTVDMYEYTYIAHIFICANLYLLINTDI
jgi:hypothetical protein